MGTLPVRNDRIANAFVGKFPAMNRILFENLCLLLRGVPGVTRFHLQQSAVRMNDDYASLICDITPPFSRTVIRMNARMLPATVEIRNGTT